MARKYLMSWEGDPYFRWVKMYKGVRYRVACHELHGVMVFSQEGSYKAANEWWERKLAELHPVSKITPMRVIRETVEERGVDGLKDKAKEGDAAKMLLAMLENMGYTVETAKTPDERVAAGAEILKSGETEVDIVAPVGVDMTETIAYMERTGHQPLGTDQRAELLGRILSPLKKQAIGADLDQHKQEYLALKRGKVKPSTYRELSDVLTYVLGLKDGKGQVMPPEAKDIDEATVKRVYVAIDADDLDPITKKKRFRIFKTFVSYLAESDCCPVPRNLNSKLFAFAVKAKKIKTHDPVKTWKAVLELPPRLRVYALLGLNCGMTNVDIGDLTKEMVDLEGGTLTRKRVKTEDWDNVPTVTYKLWPETVALLKDQESDHATLMLTSDSGTKLYEEWVDEATGKTKKKDLIRLIWKRSGKAKCGIMLKEFRSISATILESHESYGRYTSHFLAHSPKSIKDKHYAAPSDDLFFKIMDWLRGKIFE